MLRQDQFRRRPTARGAGRLGEQPMKLLTLEIIARSPLVFPVRKPGEQFRRSAEYVPGATIYGALGLQLNQQSRFDRRLFYAIRCHNAYPAWPEDAWSRPLPRTAEKPKASD